MKSVEMVVAVEALAASGDGVVRVNGRSAHVPGVLPGERVRLAVARDVVSLVEVIERSPTRVEPPCPVFSRCGGCAWQHASPEAQRDARLALLRRALPRELREVDIAWHGSPSPWGWRTRARLAWETHQGAVRLGHRARGSHEVVPSLACAVLDPVLDGALAALTAGLGAIARRGEVSLAVGAEGLPVVCVYPEGTMGAEGYRAAETLRTKGFAGLALHVAGVEAPAVWGDARPVVTGADGAPLRIGIDGFAQAHATLNRALAEHVVARADAKGRRVLELYAGAGNFTVGLARASSAVTAVESDGGAVEAMRENLARRGIENVTVRRESAEACADAKGDVVVLDPPRTGAREVCEALAKRSNVRTVVYVSCDPPTLGRDLAALAGRYAVRDVAAFEMFPQTAHVETVVTLERATSAAGRVVRSADSAP